MLVHHYQETYQKDIWVQDIEFQTRWTLTDCEYIWLENEPPQFRQGMLIQCYSEI